MCHVSFAAHTRYRLYDLDLPLRIPGFAVGFAISKFKQIGVWEKMPIALRRKAHRKLFGRMAIELAPILPPAASRWRTQSEELAG